MCSSDLPLLQRLAPLAASAGAPADWRLPQPTADDVGNRPALDALGPFRWQPQAAPAFDIAMTDGSRCSLAARHGKNTLLVFYLGFGCVHCVEQLQTLSPKLAAFAQANIDLVAIGNEPIEKVLQLQQSLPPDQRLSLRLGSDPELAAFRAFRAYDDFERMPLHALVLIDADEIGRAHV